MCIVLEQVSFSLLYWNIYKYIFTYLDTMIILLLMLAFLHHNGMAAIKGYEEVEKSLLLKLGNVYKYLKFLRILILFNRHLRA